MGGCSGCQQKRIRFQQKLAEQKLAEIKRSAKTSLENTEKKTPRQIRIEARNERIRLRNLRAKNLK